MEYGTVPGLDRPVSRLVQGTIMISEDDLAGSFALLDQVYAIGCTTFDTARHYGHGNEATVGRWLRERGLRDEIVIIGKGAHHGPAGKRVTPNDITADIDESLRQFGIETIDLYLLHRDDPAVPVAPIVEVLNEHLQAGKIRAFGGSNWTTARIAEANAYAAAQGLTPFVASSPQLSLAEQTEPPWEDCLSISGAAGAADRDWYRRQGMPLFTWSSLAGGFFSGRYTRENISTIPGDAADRTRRVYATEENFRRLDRARRLGAERGLTIPQVALAFVLSQPLNVFALVGSENAEELAANAAASAVQLTPDELEWLDLRRDER